MKKFFWDCWRSCKSSKKVERQKFKRHGRATKRGTYCEMKGTKANGVEEKNDEHETEERKDEGKGADKK